MAEKTFRRINFSKASQIFGTEILSDEVDDLLIKKAGNKGIRRLRNHYPNKEKQMLRNHYPYKENRMLRNHHKYNILFYKKLVICH